jgi:O-antigen/teichoic acid export membrane protein
MSTRKTVARNAVVLMGTQIVTWTMALLLTISLPRFLGPAAIGKYHFANSVWAILAMLASLGMDTYLTKETARHPAQVGSPVWHSALLRCGLFVACLGGLAVYLEAFHYPQDTRAVAYVIGASSLVWLLISAAQSILTGLEQMQYVSLGNIAGRVAGTVGSLVLLLLGQGVVVIAAVNVLAALVTLAIESYFLRRLIHIPLRTSAAEMGRLVKGGLPYLLSGIFLVLYMQFDFVVISLLVDDSTVGWYGAADQMFGTLLFVPTVLMTAVFPVLSRMYLTDAGRLLRVTRKSFDLLVLLSIPIGLGVLAVANPTVLLLFGEPFAPSGTILALLGIVLIPTYLNVFIGQYLISVDRQNQWTLVMAVATVATLPLDLWLIPWCAQVYGNGGIGGALSFVITEGGMLLTGLLLMPKGTLGRTNLWLAARALLAGLVMLAAAWWLGALPLGIFIRLALSVVGGGAVYLLAGWVLRLVAPEDVALAKELGLGMLRRIQRRFRGRSAAEDGQLA